jgi:hypothetical protein
LAHHPFFWSGYLLIDSGHGTAASQVAAGEGARDNRGAMP